MTSKFNGVLKVVEVHVRG